MSSSWNLISTEKENENLRSTGSNLVMRLQMTGQVTLNSHIIQVLIKFPRPKFSVTSDIQKLQTGNYRFLTSVNSLVHKTSQYSWVSTKDKALLAISKLYSVLHSFSSTPKALLNNCKILVIHPSINAIRV